MYLSVLNFIFFTKNSLNFVILLFRAINKYRKNNANHFFQNAKKNYYTAFLAMLMILGTFSLVIVRNIFSDTIYFIST